MNRTTDSLRDAVGLILITIGVLLALVSGLALLGAIINWVRCVGFTGGQEITDVVGRNLGLGILLSSCGLVGGVVCVKLARRVQIPKHLRELLMHHK